MKEKVAILDAGAQYGKVIDRRCRELSVESDLLPFFTSAEELKKNYDAFIISGGHQSVYDSDAPEYDSEIFSMNVPVLGICYGMHLLNYVLGGSVERKGTREDGECEIDIDNNSGLFDGLSLSQRVLMSHGDSIGNLADGFEVIARSGGLVAAIEDVQRGFYGVQFHPEVDLTENGGRMLENFLYGISGFSGTYTMKDREETAIQYIRETVGDKKALVLVSGGVDSSVCASLVNKALGSERVYAIHVDNGFMRLNESRDVERALGKCGLELRVVDASENFYNAVDESSGGGVPLNRIVSPEEKRRSIGDEFMRVSTKAIENLGLDISEDVYLVQGTLRPDLIESASALASGNADAIKTHHNDTPLVRKLRGAGRVIEPLRDYHKDEVRVLGRSLGLPNEMVMRQPFPGPGLAVRIICAEKPYITDNFEKINEELKRFAGNGIDATLLPVQTVGVQGDGRSYSYLVGLSGERDWERLFSIAREVPKKLHEVNRLVYVFGERVAGSVSEITPTHLTPDVIGQLRLADNIVNEELVNYDLLEKLSQVPVVSFPVGFGVRENRSIGIRTFITNDFMTGRPAIPACDIPEEALFKMVNRIMGEVSGVSRVCYDLTSKPPGTTEWE